MLHKNDTAIKEFILLGFSENRKVKNALFVVFLFMYLVILIANSLIALATVTDSQLHTPMYFFLTNLSFVDISFSSSVLLRLLRDLLTDEKTILFAQCVAQMYIAASVGGAECISLAVLAYDRYIAICYPLHYTIIINKAVCIKIAVGTWICAFLSTISHVALTLTVEFCGHNIINHFFCEVPEILALGCGNVTAAEFGIFVIAVIMLIIPLSFIIITYINIIRAILKISSAEGRKKTFSTCISHIMVVSMFYGSVVAAYMKPQSAASPNSDKIFAIFYTVVTPMLNPLIYTLRNKTVKSALRKLYWRLTYFFKSPK